MKIETYRADFPMLTVRVEDQPMIYFNNAATALKPKVVLEAMADYYLHRSVNIARSVDALTYETTQAYEETRHTVAAFIGASSPEEIVFTRGATAALNLVANSYGEQHVLPGDEIVVSDSEHHANYIPWQQLAKRKQARLVIVPTDENGVVTPEALAKVLSPKTKVVSLFHMSNVMGATNPIQQLADLAHQAGSVFVCDGAQGIVHDTVDVTTLGVDFYAFSAHKLFGPTGVGVLYGRKALLENMSPVEFGGEMIDVVDVYDTSFAKPPYRFEAGTMPIAEVIGLGAAVRYIQNLPKAVWVDRVEQLTRRLIDGLSQCQAVEIYNPNNANSGLVSFNVLDVHPHDAAGIYDRAGILIRAGQHCSQPSMRRLNQQSTLRASLAFYNTEAEVDQFIQVTEQAGDFLDVLF